MTPPPTDPTARPSRLGPLLVCLLISTTAAPVGSPKSAHSQSPQNPPSDERLATCSQTLPPSSLSADDASGTPDPTGYWAQKTVMTGISKVPVVGKVTSTTKTYQLVRITRKHDGSDDGDQSTDFQLSANVCKLNLSNNSSLVHPEIPESFIQSLETSVRGGRLMTYGSHYWLQMPKHTQIIGADLRQPGDENLPDDPDDPRVRDQDNDGHPGMTVRIRGIASGELYLVQRGRNAWRARFQSADHIRGCIDWSQTQSVLDSSNFLLGDGPTTTEHPDESRSTLTMHRLSDADPSCSDALDAFETSDDDQ